MLSAGCHLSRAAWFATCAFDGRRKRLYQARLIGPDDQKSKSYRPMQPFGQVPAFEYDNLVLFESGAILLHIADRSDVLMPSDPKARARTTA